MQYCTCTGICASDSRDSKLCKEVLHIFVMIFIVIKQHVVICELKRTLFVSEND